MRSKQQPQLVPYFFGRGEVEQLLFVFLFLGRDLLTRGIYLGGGGAGLVEKDNFLGSWGTIVGKGNRRGNCEASIVCRVSNPCV